MSDVPLRRSGSLPITRQGSRCDCGIPCNDFLPSSGTPPPPHSRPVSPYSSPDPSGSLPSFPFFSFTPWYSKLGMVCNQGNTYYSFIFGSLPYPDQLRRSLIVFTLNIGSDRCSHQESWPSLKWRVPCKPSQTSGKTTSDDPFSEDGCGSPVSGRFIGRYVSCRGPGLGPFPNVDSVLQLSRLQLFGTRSVEGSHKKWNRGKT